jgi:hypothetical protein
MDGDIRGLANSSNLASDRADRLSRSIRGVSGRLGQMQRVGSLAGHEMDYMRRSMGLLSRDLRMAARAGELTEDEFHRLRDELDETRLGFDRLDNEIRRHNAVSQRAARDAAAAQREERRQQMADGQQRVSLMQRLNRAHDAALRENARRNTAARREELRQQMAHGQQMVSQQRRINRAHAAALREEAARNRRAEAERRRLAAQVATRLRQEEADFRRHVSRLASIGDNDEGMTGRFQGLGGNDLNRMARALQAVGNAMNGVSTSNARARSTAQSLNGDLRVMSRLLADAARNGRLSQREFNALSRGLTQAANGARGLRSAGALTRGAFRDTSREIAYLRAQLRLLGDDGSIFDRLDSRLLIFQHRLRDTSRHGGLMRRSMRGMGDGLTDGLRGAVRGVGGLLGVLRQMGSVININRRWTAILIAALVLIGPIAQALGALLVTALGGAFIALGAFALRGSTQVRNAFNQMRGTLDDVLTESAIPLESALVGGMNQISGAARRMQPALTRVFASTAPLVKDFTGGLTDLFEYALPGFEQALSRSGPVMEGFRTAMGMLGSGLGDMFASMTEDGGAQGLKQVWETLGTELKNLLVNIGQFTNAMSQSATATALLVGVFRALSGVLHIVEGGMSFLDRMFGDVLSQITGSIGGVGKFEQRIDGLGGVFRTTAEDVDALKNKLAEVDVRIAKMKEARDSALAKGPKGDDFLASVGATDGDLNAALQEREGLVGAIADAEMRAASETRNHAGSVKELIGQIQALADLNRNYMDAQAAQEQAIADATKKQNKWGEALSWSNGQLERNGQAGRDAYEQLSNIARTTKEATDKAIEANAPWSQINERWKEGRASLISMADGWGLNKTQAQQLADQILGMPPSKEVFVKAETAGAINSLDGVIAAMEATPESETITVEALTGKAQKILEDLGYTVTRMPDGSFKISAEAGAASADIAAVQAARDRLAGKKITIAAATGSAVGNIARAQAARNRLSNKSITIIANTGPFRAAVGGIAGSIVGTAYINVQRRYDNSAAKPFGAQGGKASSLPMKRFASGGSISGQVLEGPGTKTSDGIIARLSRGEFVMRAAAVDKYGVDTMRRINLGMLPKFASGGSAAAKKMREARDDLVPYLTVSRFGQFAGSKNSEFISAMTKMDSRQDLVDDLNRMRTSIKKSTSGRTESRLLGQLDAAGKGLLKYQSKLTSVNKSLEKAKEKLDGLKDASSQLKDSIKQGIIGELNLTRSASREDSQVTLNTIMSQLTADSSRANQFTGMLETLKKRGFSGRVLEQVAQAGVEGGGLETATALMSASASQIKQINDMNQSIRQSADDAGDVAADALYAAGIKAAEGLVKGLERQKASIEKVMLNIAKSMEKAIKKALGIKSPSRVMQKLGHYTAEGFALGIEKNSRPEHAWTSMLNVPASSSGGASYAGGRSGEPMVIQLNIGGNSIGEVIIDPLRKSIRHRGGNVQAVLGK